MKHKVFFWLFSLMAYMGVARAQEVPAGLTDAFKLGNAAKLSMYMGEKPVEIITSEGTKDYSKPDATKFMTDFFADNKVKTFSINHQGKRNGSGFIVGTLTASGGTYRINCFFKKENDNYLIHQIRIDKTNE